MVVHVGGGSSVALSDHTLSITHFVCSYAGSELSASTGPREIPFSQQLLAVKHVEKSKGRQGGKLSKLFRNRMHGLESN